MGVLVFFCILRRIIPKGYGALIGALLFGLHPIRTEAVAWAAGRPELLCNLFCLVSIHLYLLAAEKKRAPALLMGSLAAFALGALSKENALALPGVLAACELFLIKKRRLMRLAPFVVAALLLVGVRFGVLGALGPQEGQVVLPQVTYPERIQTAGWVLSRYVTLSFWPHPLKPNYRPLEFMDSTLISCAPAAGFLILVLIALFFSKRAALASAFFLVPLIPVLNLVPIGELLAERFLYLPIAGVCMAAGLFFEKMRLWKGALFTGLLGACVVLTVAQTEVWTNHFTLWSHGTAMDEKNPQPHLGLAAALITMGQGEKALERLRTVQELNPNYKPEQVHFNLGRAYEALGRNDEAIDHYELATDRSPYNLGYLKKLLDLDSKHHRLKPEKRKRLEAFLKKHQSLDPNRE